MIPLETSPLFLGAQAPGALAKLAENSFISCINTSGEANQFQKPDPMKWKFILS